MTAFLLRGLLFLLPFILFYVLVKVLRARSRGEALDDHTVRLVRVAMGAIVLTVVLGAVWRLTHQGADPSMKYIPPQVVDGEVQPGHFEKKDNR
ncbi:MAG: hypothetical protein KAI28_00295 [Sphingomonadales bacterium]|nr:hypothetical protein [Sphingomonadales bacterium]